LTDFAEKCRREAAHLQTDDCYLRIGDSLQDFFDEAAEDLLNQDESSSGPLMGLIEALSLLSPAWRNCFWRSELIRQRVFEFIHCDSTELAVPAIVVLGRFWSRPLRGWSEDPRELLEMLTQFPRLEASRVVEMVKILHVLLPRLRNHPAWSSVPGDSCDWLLQCFRDFPKYPILSEVIEVADQMLSLDKSTEHWIRVTSSSDPCFKWSTTSSISPMWHHRVSFIFS
jgi:hypothetical protein